ncbi:LacI family DNA-binding transcriptional regulator [Carboxylicivirga marina]|uniref:LacI family DNA-binding transcriptional regulator n=1 Tax=Carboxylicivirga marina TaxID=2800988 RepID=A0ABS1HN61_9BACT|nr:LacI family DNA-binding transcriptional regulator [Carboxylicivirga marina]MBK3519122.1 LacI family DNA-binding transcriptional regulator [Carboxylicivirga marina]
MKASIKIIAEQSGVSKTTVSFVLNGRGDEKNISADTQKRVLDTALRLNYQPNHLARSLSTGRSYTIGFVVPDISNPFFSRIARLVEHYAEEKGYSVMMASTDEKPEKEQKIINSFHNRQIDGVIIAPSSVDMIKNTPNFPFVTFDRQMPNFRTANITINNEESAYQLTQKLFERGCNRVGVVTLKAFLPNIKQRIDGYKKALQDNKLITDMELIVEANINDIRATIKSGIDTLMNLSRPVNGIFFLNNVLATEGIWVFNRYYPQLLDKVLFASFDNIDVFDYVQPKVISALQPGEEIARNCVNMLIAQIEGKNLQEAICLSTTIIER